MNISHNISASAQAPLPERNQGLSHTQSSKLEYVLSNYDAAALTDTDAIEIVEKIRDIGITSGQALGHFLAESGFDANEIADKAGLRKPNNMPPPVDGGGFKGEINSEAIEQLSLFLENFDGEDINAADWDKFFTGLEDKGIDLSRPMMDIKL